MSETSLPSLPIKQEDDITVFLHKMRVRPYYLIESLALNCLNYTNLAQKHTYGEELFEFYLYLGFFEDMANGYVPDKRLKALEDIFWTYFNAKKLYEYILQGEDYKEYAGITDEAWKSMEISFPRFLRIKYRSNEWVQPCCSGCI